MKNRTPNPGAWVRRKRKENNLSQKQLADATGLSVYMIRCIEKNDLKIGSTKLLAVADYFCVSMEEIIYGFDAENSENR